MSRSTTSRRRVVALAGSGAIVVTGAGAGAVLFAPTGAGASATFTVDTVSDSGPGSLRAAITAANAAGGHDVIEFSPSLTGTITLLTDLPAITEEVSIHGNGVAVIDGGWRDGGPSGHQVLAFTGVSGTVEVSGVDITGGQAGYGAAIGVFYSSADVTVSTSSLHANRGRGAIANKGATGGSLTVVDSTIVDNSTAVGQWGGGGIMVKSSAAPVRIERTTFTGNYGAEGGGLYLDTPDGTANVVVDSAFVGNSSLWEGGAIHVFSGDLTITGSTFTGNLTQHSGGALYLDKGETVIVDSSFTGNVATQRGGAIFGGASSVVESSLTIRRTTIADNEAGTNGGGVAARSTIRVEESTISGNVADGDGGGMYVFYSVDYSSSLVAVNSTISGNEAGGTGGAILTNAGGTVLVADTVMGNSAAGAVDGIAVKTVGIGSIAADPTPTPGVVSLVSTILAGNGDADLGRATGPVDPTVTADHSLVGTSSVTVTNLGGTVTGVAAAALKLGPLADNGGPTKTHALLAGSPALNAGPASLPSFEGDAYDQRGEPYVRIYGGTVDIGAYEEQPRPQPAPEPVPEPTFTG